MRRLCTREISVFELSTLKASQLRDLASEISDFHAEFISQATALCIANHVYKSHEFGVSLDSSKDREVEGKCRRLCDPEFWLRRITQVADKARENIAVRSLRLGDPALGLEPYCSDESLSAYLERQSGRSIHSLRRLQREIEKTAHSSYLISKALRERAFAEGYLSVMVTLGVDGRYHSSSPQYEGLVFEDAHAALHGICESLLDGLSRQGVRGVDFYGARCIEVHADGCPHWHMLIYLRPDLLPYLKTRLRLLHYRQSKEMGLHFDSFSERIVQVRETKDFSQYCAAVSYIFKNSYAGRAGDRCQFINAVRQKVAISIHGKRQYDFIGAAGRTVMRELRRHKGVGGAADDLVVDRGEVNRRERQYTAVKRLINGDVENYRLVKQEGVNRYGERVEKVVGVLFSKDGLENDETAYVCRSGVICNDSSIRVDIGYVFFFVLVSVNAFAFLTRAPPNILIL